MAGDLQLGSPVQPIGKKVATKGQKHDIFRPSYPVPVSGVYDVVDEDGNYLGEQRACHAGREFPPALLPSTQRNLPESEREYGYGYRLAYEAAHLVPASSEGEIQPYGQERQRIFLPEEPVTFSGVYGVVDENGNYLDYQRALVNRPYRARTEYFPPFSHDEPAGAYGYRLQYEAENLHTEPPGPVRPGPKPD